MHHRSMRPLAVLGLALLAACGDSGTGPDGSLGIGEGIAASRGQDLRLQGGASGAEFAAILVNTSLTTGGAAAYTFSGTGLTSPTGLLAATGGVSAARTSLGLDGALAEPTLDRTFESRLRTRERAKLTPRFSAARTWYASRGATAPGVSASKVPGFDVSRPSYASLPVSSQVGDIVQVNVNADDPCDNAIYHPARVVAIGTKALILADTLNPKNGFTTADYQRYAARFDTLVYPVDVGAFGEPSDIDKNGHIAIVFTRAVNELTPRGSGSYVGGLTFSRDLFPVVATSRATACPASNEGEYFYMLAPDPTGEINGNRRTVGFVDSATTSVLAHEFQHLINASRRLYVNTTAGSFEEKWLDEGLAHEAEELLFYRESGLAPRSNLTVQTIRSTPAIRAAFNADMAGNAGRYRSYLIEPAKSSPYSADDSLSTRGAAWSFLRYLADRTASSDGQIWFRLANSTTSGIQNAQAVFGGDFAAYVRDWSVSNAVDDFAGVAPEYQQPSWNWHNIFATILAGGYPLQMASMTDGTSVSGSVVAGGAAYYKLGVPANGTASLTLGSQASNLQLVVVRTK
jgi:hypothetical protein